MYAIIRRYRTHSASEVARKVEKEFLPLISAARGFLSYYVVDEGKGIQSSISIFEDRESAELSNLMAAVWVREHPTSLPEPPEISSGEVLVFKGD
jgi:hypothetical protein